MSALLPANRRAERFAALVDATSSTGVDSPYAPLLEVVGTLRAAADEGPAPRADYVADLRSRLMAEADTALVPTDARLVLPQRHAPRPRKQSRVTAAVAGLVLVGVGAGMAVATQSSVPGDGLYPLKRGLEHVGERLNLSDAGRGRDLLGQATARFGEVDTLLERDASDAAGGRDAAQLHPQRRRRRRRPVPQLPARRRRRRHRECPRTSPAPRWACSPTCPPTRPSSLRPDFADAAQLLTDLDQQATTLCGDCGPRGPLGLPARPAAGLAQVRARGPARRDPAWHRLDAADRCGLRCALRYGLRYDGRYERHQRRLVRRPGQHRGPERDHPAAARAPPRAPAHTSHPARQGARPPRTRTGSDPSSGPLGGTLPTPSAPASGLPNVDDVTGQVKKDVGSVTNPLTR